MSYCLQTHRAVDVDSRLLDKRTNGESSKFQQAQVVPSIALDRGVRDPSRQTSELRSKQDMKTRLKTVVCSLAVAVTSVTFAADYPDAILADGPLAYYRFSDNLTTAA